LHDLSTLTVDGCVGVQQVEQRPDLRSWKVWTKEILFCTLWTLLSEEVASTATVRQRELWVKQIKLRWLRAERFLIA